jgi:predicted nucleotidyltransferase
MTTVHPRLPISPEELAAFCKEWQVTEFALFGSATREDFRDDSDIDVMVEFAPEAEWSFWDLVRMQDELGDLLHRRVDLVEKGTIVNPYRLRSISRDLTVIYAT